MPTILLINGFRFFFYSNENKEPSHIHVSKGNASGKIWLEPTLIIAFMHGFNSHEEKDIIDITTIHHELLKNKWNEYFNK